MSSFEGKTALVTGASAGIGRAFARALAASGSHLVLTARREERLRELARELEQAHAVRVTVIPLDLSEPGSAAALAAACEARGARVDVLVNNAGTTDPKLFIESDWAAHQRFLQLMLNGPVELCRRLLPAMVERGYGRIVNVSSVAGLVHGSYGHSLYGASKAFLVRFSESLSLELEGTGVQITATCPGLTHSEFHDVVGARDRVSKIPELQWMQAEAVVKEALEAVEAGKSVVVNGALNRVATEVARYVPDTLLRRMVKRASLQVSPKRR
jgi:short-subunit dehydrogenase